jgi:DNA polymerase I
MRVVFDLETNGLPRQGLDRIHCLVIKDLDTNEVFRYNDTGSGRPISEGVNLLNEAELVAGHNIVGFDIPVLKEFYGFFGPEGEVVDSLILSRLFFPDILARDFRNKPTAMPGNLYGRHSLEAWGYRVCDYKSDFGKTSDWKEWSKEMEDYCEQDVHVAATLFEKFNDLRSKYPKPIELEHACARVMAIQEQHGWPFDVTAAERLEGELRTESEKLADTMRATFPYVDGGSMIPKRPNKTKGYIAGAEFTKLKEFNPTSRDHIAWAFSTWRKWKPDEFTDKGKPKIDEAVLLAMDTEESRTFARLLELQKALGQLSEGTNAWLKQVTPQGRIHHACQLATNTGRNAHTRPNLAQVSSDPRCRALFGPGPGMVQVGADASGLELRMLGHYLAFYDKGSFADVVVNGDIHQQNADRVGVSRKEVKTITYAFLYGAGDKKIGLSVDKTLTDAKATKLGKEIRAKFVSAIPGLDQLLKAVDERAKGDVLKGLDGRLIRLQGKKHAALNYLLQSAGAICCKAWVVKMWQFFEEMNLNVPTDLHPLGFIHDEVQLAVHPNHVDAVSQTILDSMPLVGQDFKLNVPLAAEVQVGKSWADCH